MQFINLNKLDLNCTRDILRFHEEIELFYDASKTAIKEMYGDNYTAEDVLDYYHYTISNIPELNLPKLDEIHSTMFVKYVKNVIGLCGK